MSNLSDLSPSVGDIVVLGGSIFRRNSSGGWDELGASRQVDADLAYVEQTTAAIYRLMLTETHGQEKGSS